LRQSDATPSFLQIHPIAQVATTALSIPYKDNQILEGTALGRGHFIAALMLGGRSVGVRLTPAKDTFEDIKETILEAAGFLNEHLARAGSVSFPLVVPSFASLTSSLPHVGTVSTETRQLQDKV
jgi:hypothetical protein